jgi:acid phosphatase
MNRYHPGIAILGALLFAGCATSPTPTPVPKLYEVKKELSRYVSSGRYQAEVASVYARASAYLAGRAHGETNLAIVLDVDETVLSNVRLLKLNDWALYLTGPTNSASGPCSLAEWIKLERGEPIEPALDLVRLARGRGVAVFLISARPESLRVPTEKNLRAVGCEWTGLILKPSKLQVKSEVEYKAPARQLLSEKGYRILVSVGDQESDLAGGFAERTFKLPNPFYFAP